MTAFSGGKLVIPGPNAKIAPLLRRRHRPAAALFFPELSMPPSLTVQAASTASSAPPGRGFWLAALLPPTLAVPLLVVLFQFDRSGLMLALQSATRSLPDTFWAALTLLGNGGMLFACMALAWRRRTDWLMAGVCALPFATIYSRALKHFIVSPRPAGVLPAEQLHVIGERLLNHSFPSGHTVSAFVVASIILLAGRPPRAIAVLAIVLALLVGLSRIAVGAHWPTDVLAGAAGGWLAGALGVALAGRWAWTRSKRAEQLVALIVLLTSLTLFVVNIGYTEAILFKYVVAAVGAISALRWLLAKSARC